MRTMMKKCGVYATFAAVLLVMAVLVTGCPESAPGTSGYQPPAGMGSVQLIFNETIERATILPDTATIASFQEFVLTFTAAGGGAVTVGPITRTYAARNTPVNLVPGSYSVQVVAHLTAGTPASAAAVYTSPAGTPLSIVATNVTPITITLKPYDPATSTGSGTFAWNITNNITDALDTGSEMKLTTLAGGTVTGWTDIDLTVPGNLTNATGVSIPSNYYYVDITLIVNSVPRDFRHVLHIYQNMKSTFSYTFTDSHITTTVTFTPDITYVHPTDTPPSISAAAISATPNPLAGTGTVNDPYVLSLTDTDYPTGLTITVSNNATFTGGIKYYVNSTAITPPGTISTSSAPFNAVGGPYQIMVEGTVGATNGAPYYTEFFVRVAP